MKLSRTSIALLAIQLALVSSIAAKYLYQRSTCPKVWLRTEVYDPEMLMRGRYIALSLPVHACGGIRPAAPNPSGTNAANPNANQFVQPFPAKLSVEDGKLIATGIPEVESHSSSVWVNGNGQCDNAGLRDSVDFYIPEHTELHLPSRFGPDAQKNDQPARELWVEVTVPPAGPPRPLALALKSADGKWQPLNYR
jgi:hypothetical protein